MIKTTIKDNIIINTISSEATLPEVFMYIANHIDVWKDRHIIWNMNDFIFNDETTETFRQFIMKGEDISEKRKGLKTAIVVRSDLGYGMMRMFSMLAEGRLQFSLQTFRNLAEAKKWLLNK